MLLHKSNLDEILSMHKRSSKLALEGPQDEGHKFYIVWSNIKMFLDSMLSRSEYDGYLDLLGYFASKIDEHAESNILSSDETIRSMMYEWLAYANKMADFSLWDRSKSISGKPFRIKE